MVRIPSNPMYFASGCFNRFHWSSDTIGDSYENFDSWPPFPVPSSNLSISLPLRFRHGLCSKSRSSCRQSRGWIFWNPVDGNVWGLTSPSPPSPSFFTIMVMALVPPRIVPRQLPGPIVFLRFSSSHNSSEYDIIDSKHLKEEITKYDLIIISHVKK